MLSITAPIPKDRSNYRVDALTGNRGITATPSSRATLARFAAGTCSASPSGETLGVGDEHAFTFDAKPSTVREVCECLVDRFA